MVRPWSTTYLGGSSEDVGRGIAVHPSTGEALVTGWTISTNFPTANPFQATNRGMFDAFVTRLRADGRALAYSTYLGGSDWDFGSGIAVDPRTGDALVTGSAYSTNFPTINPFQATNRGGWDAFVTRLRANGTALYSTYLGGSGDENVVSGGAIAVDPRTGDALVAGWTGSTNFPTVNPFQASYGGSGSDAFVARLRADVAAPGRPLYAS